MIILILQKNNNNKNKIKIKIKKPTHTQTRLVISSSNVLTKCVKLKPCILHMPEVTKKIVKNDHVDTPVKLRVSY